MGMATPPAGPQTLPIPEFQYLSLVLLVVASASIGFLRRKQSEWVCKQALSGLTADEVFRLHTKIRWAAYSTEQGQVLFSSMRKGVKSYTPNSDDRAFMELGVVMLCEMGKRLSVKGGAGNLESIIVRFTYDSVLIVDHGRGHLALSVDNEHALRVFDEIAVKLKLLPE
jgi:hypothetical protein